MAATGLRARARARICTAAACTPSGSGPSRRPCMMNFDAASRETCIVRANRTNTPLQALNLMNDVDLRGGFARVLAERMMKEGGATPERASLCASGWPRRAHRSRRSRSVLLDSLRPVHAAIVSQPSPSAADEVPEPRANSPRDPQARTPASWPPIRVRGQPDPQPGRNGDQGVSHGPASQLGSA